MVLFVERVGGTGVGCGVVEQRLDGGVEALLQDRTRLRVELAAQAPHPGLEVGPGTQSGVAPLPLEAIDPIVVLGAADLVAQGSPELGRRWFARRSR